MRSYQPTFLVNDTPLSRAGSLLQGSTFFAWIFFHDPTHQLLLHRHPQPGNRLPHPARPAPG
ncbi:hypothetical protein DKY63_01220 [Pseudomonas putida]|uniref:Uncharacterized protein n=1 Tax=Pseudomonas putida TaxID=303 RepID=A0A2Z4RCU5_PSEPU|nr:hypothetical protein DKY63_01220 [Pseudomonas putida]